MATLINRTQSKAPIVRGDWWVMWVSQAEDRQGSGYYEMLGIKNRDEFDKLVALDVKLAEERQKEVRAVMRVSGVSVNNRGIVRHQTINGPRWTTLDTNDSKGKRNALKNLDKDLLHDAEEGYGSLNNGLPAFIANDAKGILQRVVPTKIAGNSKTLSNDVNIHIGGGCVECHAEAIRPIADWTRQVYQAPVLLVDPDKDRLRRLKRLYLSDLESHVKDDQLKYARAIFKATGRKPEELAKAQTRLHNKYVYGDIYSKDAAREFGFTEVQVRETVKRVAHLTPPLDPVFAGWLATPRIRPVLSGCKA